MRLLSLGVPRLEILSAETVRRVISRNNSAFMAEAGSPVAPVAHRCEIYVKVGEPRCFALNASVNRSVATCAEWRK